ncbi:MAG: tetraacyldisaccharide 4'-kinase [Ginsengibacter sp.]
MLRSFRFILFPLSVIYGGVISLRNWLFDKNIFKSGSFNFPVICVGNLATGGTGKTPMVEYLLTILKQDYKIATLSRGYKRKTLGFAIADENTTAIDIGDEPMQFHKKFHGVTVAVAEERLVAIPQLLHARPDTQVIILDDALQHREVKAGLNILLTEFTNLYTRDFILPAGDLRDVKSSRKRADIIMVTKCKSYLSDEERNGLIEEIKPLSHQQIFFTRLEYNSPYHLFTNEEKFLDPETHILLICGIANPKPIKEVLTRYSSTYDMMSFRDHHIFDMDDLKDIKKQFEKIESENKIILTTEKDGVRLAKFEAELKDMPVFVFPVKHKIMFGQEEEFEERIKKFIGSYPKFQNN